MTRARAEIAALLMKAARGAGLPLGLAEDLYLAADYVTADDVMQIAAEIDTGGAELIAVINALDDIACDPDARCDSALGPAFAAARGWVLADGLRADAQPQKQIGALDIPEDVLSRLDALAARTYVPETAASRARGAGAGAIDND